MAQPAHTSCGPRWRAIRSGKCKIWCAQQTVVGALLFLLYIDDIASNISSTIKLFADDCFLYRLIKTTNDTDIRQEDLAKLSDWSKIWLMNFNVKKCNSMSITTKKKVLTPHEPYNIGGSALDRVSDEFFLQFLTKN